MREYDDEVPYVVIERSGSGLGSFLLGALLGAGAALLLAPKTGSETQQDLKDRARRLRERAEARMEDFESSLQDMLTEGRRQLEDRLETAKKAVNEGRDRAQAAFDAGRRAAKEGREEMEQEVARAGQGDAEASSGPTAS